MNMPWKKLLSSGERELWLLKATFSTADEPSMRINIERERL